MHGSILISVKTWVTFRKGVPEMKENYEALNMEIITFTAEDIVTASGDNTVTEPTVVN